MGAVRQVCLVLALGCGDAPVADGGTTEAPTTSTSTSTSTTTSTTSTTSTDSSSSEGSSSTSGVPDEPPADSDFEWEPVEALDCGDRGTVIHDAGPSANRVNFVILGDGYTKGEIDDVYVDDVDRFLTAMFGADGFPYDVYTRSVNICRIEVISAESGIDFPGEDVEVETALDAWGDPPSRLAYVSITKLEAELADALATSNIEPDWVAVALNTDRWVAAGGYPMIWPGGQEAAEIGVHEAGHTFHMLADEYGGKGALYEGGEPAEINVTADLESDKWEVWLGYDQQSLGEIDFYEGGRYFDMGMWRPSFDGRMRTVERAHNAPSIDKIIRDIYELARPIDDFSPKVMNEYPEALGVRLVDEDNVVVDWLVDDELVLEGAGPRIWTAELALTPGPHSVTAVARDPTDWVRHEDRSALEMTVVWPINAPSEAGVARRFTSRPPQPRPHRRRSTPTATGSGRPHPADRARAQLHAANFELLRARDALHRGALDKAREHLEAHTHRFGSKHAADRAVLQASLACLEGKPAAITPRRGARFQKTLHRACD